MTASESSPVIQETYQKKAQLDSCKLSKKERTEKTKNFLSAKTFHYLRGVYDPGLRRFTHRVHDTERRS